jgi:hypothetical protein
VCADTLTVSLKSVKKINFIIVKLKLILMSMSPCFHDIVEYIIS